MKELIMAAVILLGTAIMVVVVYYAITLGSHEDDYTIICLDGHEYWYATIAYKGFLGIKLDPEGKPIPCDTK